MQLAQLSPYKTFRLPYFYRCPHRTKRTFMKRIHLISSPRNLSTALMYSFAQRSDTKVVDEPFYAHYLSQTNVNHPGRDEVLSSQSSNLQEVLQKVVFAPISKDILFIKNMTSHINIIEADFLTALTNIIYIRNPKQIIASYAQVVQQNIQPSEIGTIQQYNLYQELKANHQNPIVLDSGELLKNPALMLEKLCAACGIPFSDKMLRWEAGGIPEDGVWAKYWYANVHQSTGFQKQRTSERELPPHLEPLYEQLRPYYEKMREQSILL